jgi:diacylglycerol kinase (ATP)
MRVLAVVNKAAGGVTDDYLAALRAAPGVDLRIAATEGPGDGTGCVVGGVEDADPAIVVAVGGDGTAGEVARGLAEVGPGAPPMLVAPAGTGNSNFRGLWGELAWPDVVEAVFGAGAWANRPMDLMTVAELDTTSLLGASAAMIPESLELSRSLPLTGRERLLAAAMRVLETYQPYPGRITVDGAVLTEDPALLVVVGGVRYRGGLLELLPDSLVDDGLVDVCVVDATVAAQDLGLAALSGGLTALPGVRYGRGTEIVLERLDGRPMKLEHDGELETGPHTSYRIGVVPGPFSVVVPDPVPACFAKA